MVGATGFEPATSCSRSRRSTGLSYAPPKARTAFITAARARPEGLEPTTPRSVVWCSIQLSYGRFADELGDCTPRHQRPSNLFRLERKIKTRWRLDLRVSEANND